VDWPGAAVGSRAQGAGGVKKGRGGARSGLVVQQLQFWKMNGGCVGSAVKSKVKEGTGGPLLKIGSSGPAKTNPALGGHGGNWEQDRKRVSVGRNSGRSLPRRFIFFSGGPTTPNPRAGWTGVLVRGGLGGGGATRTIKERNRPKFGPGATAK